MIYETLDGWQSTTEGVRSLEKLPPNAKKYIQLIEEHLGIPGNTLLRTIHSFLYSCHYFLTVEEMQ